MTNSLSRPSELKPGESRRANAVFREAPLSEVVAVQEVCPAGDRYVNSFSEGLMIFLTLQGRAGIEVEGMPGRHMPGSLVLVSSCESLVEQVEAEGAWRVHYLLLQGSWAEELVRSLRSRGEGSLWCEPNAPRLRQIVEEMLTDVFTQNQGWDWFFFSRCAELFGCLNGQFFSPKPEEALIQKVTRLLEETPTLRFSVGELASLTGLTSRQLLYQFRKTAGKPLGAWVREYRIEQACRLLKQGQSVTEVADGLGFANPYHFSRTFRSVVGTAPSLFRAEAQSVEPPLRRDSSEG